MTEGETLLAMEAFGGLTTLWALLLLVRLIRLALPAARSVVSGPDVRSPNAVDVTDSARRLRMRGRLLFLAYSAMTLWGLWVLSATVVMAQRMSPIQRLASFAIGIFAGPALFWVFKWWQQRKRASVLDQASVPRRPASAIAYSAAIAAILIGLSSASVGLRYGTQGPNSADVELADSLGLNSAALSSQETQTALAASFLDCPSSRSALARYSCEWAVERRD